MRLFCRAPQLAKALIEKPVPCGLIFKVMQFFLLSNAILLSLLVYMSVSVQSGLFWASIILIGLVFALSMALCLFFKTNISYLEKELQRLNAKNNAFIENLPIPVASFDSEMRYLGASPAWREIFGLPKNFVGLNHYELFEPTADCKAIHETAKRSKCTVEGEGYYDINNKKYYFRWKVAPYFIQEETPGLLVLLEDLTYQVQIRDELKERLKQLETLIKSVEEKNLLYSQALNVHATTNAILGKALQATCWDDILGDFSKLFQELYFVNQPVEVRIVDPDFKLPHTVSKLLDGVYKSKLKNQYRILIFSSRPSKTKALLVSFSVASLSLNLDHLELLAKTMQIIGNYLLALENLIQTNQKLAKTLESKTEFISTVSHEIRNPLSAIEGLSALLSETNLQPDQREYTEALKVCSDSLLTLVNDLLDCARLELGKLSLDPIPSSLFELGEKLEKQFSQLARKAGIQFNYNIDTYFINKAHIFDPVRLRQILVNLLSNAIKFTPAGGSVSFEINCLNSEDNLDSVLIKVKDSGIGIPQEQIEKIFEPYYQLDTTAKHKGTGLGLKIVKQLVDLFGGKIEVNSQINKGTEFAIYLKLRSTQPAVARSTSCKPTNLKILVAEDDEINRLVIQKLLGHQNYVKTVSNGAEALQLVNQETFDLIILDFEMPVMGGVDCCAKIKTKLSPKTPVLGLTAHSKDRIDQFENFDLVLTKPLKPDELYNAISQLIPAG